MSDEDFGSNLARILEDSGFTVVPVQALIDALAQMEEYVKERTGVDQEELDRCMQRIDDLLGPDTMNMELDEVVRWVNVLKIM